MSEYPEGSGMFYDMDGNPCTLRQLVVKEPEWAVSRIIHERKKNAALETRLAAAERDAKWLRERFMTRLHNQDVEGHPEKEDAFNLVMDDIMRCFDAAINAARGATEEQSDGPE